VAAVWFDPTPQALAGLRADVGQIARFIVGACREAGWPVIIYPVGGRRSAREQARLYAQGRTAAGPIVTQVLHSAHEEGRAFDLDLLEYERSVGMPLWRFLGAWWKAGGLRWGGDWGDYGHFEVP